MTETGKRPDYKNWVPKGMTVSLAAVTAGLSAVSVCAAFQKGVRAKAVSVLSAAGAVGTGAVTAWCLYASSKFSYDGKRQMSKQIVEGTAEYITLPKGGAGLDIGCGSGALTIACAKRNPQGTMIGMDRWGMEYASFSKKLCEENAKAEGVNNTVFVKGDAVHIDYPDETFDAVTSNYVFHNITGVNKQDLLREALRVLKKGGCFAIHDIMSEARYGDMETFMQELRDAGYRKVELIPTTDGKFMSKKEAFIGGLNGSALLIGIK